MPTLTPKSAPSTPQSPKDFNSLTLEDFDGMMNVAEPAVPDQAPAEARAAIESDTPQLESLKSKFGAASKKFGVPIDILAGVASRESHAGKALNEEGYDPEKKAFGVMQVDQRFHKLEGTESPNSQAHINQSAGILIENKRLMDKRFPHWTDEQRWRAAVAGYNMGPSKVKTLEKMDEGTTGGNYSSDVMLRAKAYKALKGKR